MIVEDLIRMGRPLLKDGMDAREILKLVSDVQDVKVKNFYRHVIVVEISEGKDVFTSHQVWGQVEEGDREDFVPDVERAIGAPFELTQGGNPLHPQGIYGVPVYPCYERHLESFRESQENVSTFIRGRLKKTPDFYFDDEQINRIASEVHKTVLEEIQKETRGKLLGILVLADTRGETAPYHYINSQTSRHIGRSSYSPGRFIEPNYNRILELFWKAKLQEGAEKGQREGECTICGKEAALITIYCKAWPWYLPTWTCPLPEGGNEKLLIEGVGICPDCYQALVYGACLFEGFTRSVQRLVTREIFSPVADREGIRMAARSSPPTIQGGGLLLPLLDRVFEDDETREEFAENVQAMLHPPPRRGMVLQRYIDAVTGFEMFLPEKTETKDYRLSLIYYSGDPSRGDIHLRAYIEDVLPSTVRRLQELVEESSKMAIQLLQALFPGSSERQQAYYNTMYRSVPFMLARGYGGAYVWDQLQTVLHRQPLGSARPMRNIYKRLRSVVPRFPEAFNEIREEVIFFLTFVEFLERYHHDLDEGGRILMRPWKELLQLAFEAPVEGMRFESSAELGFSSGALIRQFSRQYYSVTKKDYLKQRVLTFGSDLTPEMVWRRGIRQVFEVAPRYEKLRLSNNFLQRLGTLLTEYDRLREEIQRSKDEFMASFWAGYSLQGYDNPRTREEPEEEPEMTNQES